MDMFWLFPVLGVGIAFCVIFFVYLHRLPSSPSTPNVLLDKSSEPQPSDTSAEGHDWEGRPCGSYLDWLARKSH